MFRALTALAVSAPKANAVAGLLAQPDPDPNDLSALDAAWEEESVEFGPEVATGCKGGLAGGIGAAGRSLPTDRA